MCSLDISGTRRKPKRSSTLRWFNDNNFFFLEFYRNGFDICSQGWVHSGDLGRQDEDGFFYVCGRMKEILITGDTFSFFMQCFVKGGGENVAPVPIEDDIKAEMGEVVSQAMLVS